MLLTQPNTRPHIAVLQTHILPLPSCCPVSGNPQPGSVLKVRYRPKTCFLEVYALRKYIDGYIGGHEDVRDMEGMIQQITHDCVKVLDTRVVCIAEIILQRGDQMRIVCHHG